MNTPIVLDTINAFRTERETAGTASPRRDDAPSTGTFTRQELRDLVLHWMG